MDWFIELYIYGFYFYNYKSKDGFFTFTKLFTSFNLASINATFDLTLLYLNVMLYLTVSSGEAIKSQESNSINLYSIFYIKSSLAVPSLFIMKTARNEWGSLMQEFTILIIIFV